MLRMLALAVLLMTVSATAADGTEIAAPAASSPGTDREVGAAPQSDAGSVDLRVPSALAWAQSSLRGAVSSGNKRRQMAAAAGARQPVTQTRGVLGELGRLANDRDRAGLAYSLNKRFSLDLGYRFLDVEDVVVRRGEPGTVGPTYSSHHLVLHARWRF